jgi:vitamin B12 transporter
MRTPTVLAAALLAAGLSGLLAAEELEPYELKPNLVVTPTRMPEPAGQALASVSVITRSDIEYSAAEDLYELLRLQPGIDIVRTGGPGTQTSIFMRGANSSHVLVLIDGVRVSSSNTGAYAWELLPLNQIERIEIVRGPRGSLYGSDSIGGVIQVFTRSSPEPYAQATAGSFGTLAAEGGLGHQGERWQISLNAGYRDVDGYSAQNPDGFSYDPDDDGLRAANASLTGSVEADHGRWRFSVLGIDHESEFDQGVSDARQLIASLAFDGRVTDSWDYQLQAGAIDDDLFTDFGFFTTGFDSRRHELSWQNQLRTEGAGLFSFGLDYYRESGSSDGGWDQSRDNTGLFASYDHRLRRLQLQAGARYDDNSRFGSEATGQFALGYEFAEDWQLVGSYGSAFRGPNLSEQFSPGFGGLFAGNPELEPESSTSAEVGLRWEAPHGGLLSAFAYRTNVDDLIAFNGPEFQAINIDRARLRGVEVEYRLQRNGWLLNANATIADSEDLATGQPLLRRPEEKGSMTLERRLDNGAWIGVEWYYAGDREDFGGVVLDSYQLLNLRAGWPLARAWRLELRANNLADEAYEPAFGFDGAGRSWFLSVTWLP